MDLVEVDIIHAEPVQAGVDLAHDCLARQAAAVRTGTHPAIHFGRDDHLVAAGEVLDSPAEDLLAAAERITVRGVEEIDAAFECPLDERAGFLLGEAPGMVAAIGGAVAHAAEADTRDVEAGAAELHIFHRLSHDRPKRLGPLVRGHQPSEPRYVNRRKSHACPRDLKDQQVVHP